jgi:large conductance mechanosensitive channel
VFKDFKAFINKGNVIDLAVAVILGAAFGKIVASLVADIIMPPIGFLIGKVDLSNLFINLSPTSYTTLIEAKKAGAATINYGIFANTVFEFLILAICVFFVIQQLSKLKKQEEPKAPLLKECTFCFSLIPARATRCPHCTSPITS